MKGDGDLMIQVRKRHSWSMEWQPWYDPQNWIALYTNETAFDLLARLRKIYDDDPHTEFRVVRISWESVEPEPAVIPSSDPA